MVIANLIAAALALGSPVRSGGLALERGVYVDVDSPCRGGAMANRSWYGGSGYVIQAAHAQCRATHVRRLGRNSFEVREVCRDESMPNSDYRITERVHVLSATEYLLENNFGRFHARWCRE